jgi:hypothetical protein
MDELDLIENLRAEQADRDPRARAAAWGKLDERIRSAELVRMPAARTPKRGFIALAGAGILAASVAVLLVLGSGSTTQPALAAVLHQTAVIAASGDGQPTLHAGPGQYYLSRARARELRGWYPGSYEVPESPATRPGGFSAVFPVETDFWVSPEGGERTRTVLGDPRFRTAAERGRWEAGGSSLPSQFEPSVQKRLRHLGGRSGVRIVELARGVVDLEYPAHGGKVAGAPLYPDLAADPTDPAELRKAIETHRAPGISEGPGRPLGPTETVEDLTGVLHRPNASPELRAAAFDALAEVPGATLDRDTSDLLGRAGYAVAYDRPHTGLRDEFIIDPATSRFLGERTVLVDPAKDPVVWKGFKTGFVTRDVAYLETTVVDSTREGAG